MRINDTNHSTTDTNITVNALDGDDTILMDYVPPNIVVNLGAGNDRMSYGGPTHDIAGNLPQTLIEGDTGTDTVSFDDSGGPTDQGRDFFSDDLSALNQVLFNVEDMIIKFAT